MSYHDRMHEPEPRSPRQGMIYARGRLTAGWDAPDMSTYGKAEFEQRLAAIEEKVTRVRIDFRERVHTFNARCNELSVWRVETEAALKAHLAEEDEDTQAQVEYSWAWARGV